MATMLIVIKGHLRRCFSRLLTRSHSPSTLFCSLSPRFSSLAPARHCPSAVSKPTYSGTQPILSETKLPSEQLAQPKRYTQRPRQRRVNVGLMAPS